MLREFKAEFFKALAHPLRIRILDALRDGECTVNEIGRRLEVEQSTLSQQLAVLRGRNFLQTRKSGASVFYSIRDAEVFRLLDCARTIFNNQLISVQAMLAELDEEIPVRRYRRIDAARAGSRVKPESGPATGTARTGRRAGKAHI